MKTTREKVRFKIYKGYKFDKRIFRTTIILIFVFLLGVVLINGFQSKYYYSCDEPVPCDLSELQASWCKPLSKLEQIKRLGFESWLQETNLCNMAVAPPGFEFGEKPTGLQGSESLFAILFVLFAFLINHFWHNKDFEFKGGRI